MTHHPPPPTARWRRAVRAAALAGALAAAAAPAAQAAFVDGSAGCRTLVLHSFLGSSQADCATVFSLAQPAPPGSIRFAAGQRYSDAASSGLLGSAAASGFGLQADFGLLRVGAEAHSASTFSESTLSAAPSALGSAAGRFVDRLVVESATLAPGTPVRVRVSGTLDAGVTTVGVGGSAGAQVIASLLIGAPGGPLGDVFCTGTGLGSSCDIVWGGGSIPYGYEFEVDVGRAFDLSFSLTAVASASGQAGRSLSDVHSDAVAQALNSLHAFVDPVGTGFALRADSGHDWRTPAVLAVPEPGGLALSLAGLAGLLLWPSSRVRHRSVGGAGPRAWTAVALLVAGTAQAATITAGVPTRQVPSALFDPLATLADPLPAGRFLLPIEVSGASAMQDWGFDLGFDDAIVTPVDVGGLFQSVYQAVFSDADATLSEITSSGLALPGRLQGVAGSSPGAHGDGTLAYLLFAYRPGQDGQDPGFDIDDPAAQPVPEPGATGLLAMAALAFGAMRRYRDPARRTIGVQHA